MNVSATQIPPQQTEDLEVVVVTYNGRSLVEACLDSLLAESAQISMRILVVDNASQDGLPLMVRQRYPVELVETGANLGFGKAANIGLRMTSREYVLVLNPDTVVPPGAIVSCVAAMRARPRAGVLGCKLVRTDGSLDHACKREIPTPASALAYFLRRMGGRAQAPNGHYTAGHLPDDQEGVVGAVNGAFMLMRREAMEEIGLFDESFWMYGEDLDWCYRCSQHGWDVVYWPGATVVHAKGGISGRRRRVRVNFAFHRSMWLFYRKHHAVRYPAPLNVAVGTGIWTKFAASVAVNAAASLFASPSLVKKR
jgi:GT2 family glycosyltransferase